MIESRYWRQEMRHEVSWLRQNRVFSRWSEKKQVLFERRILLLAFQVRSLIDRPKVSSVARKTYVDGILFRKIGTHPLTFLSAYAFEDHFDLATPRPARLSIREICNQLVHHYVMFALRGNGRCFEVVTFVSDFKKNTCLYQFDLEALIDAFSLFASEGSASSEDPYIVLRWSEKDLDYTWHTGE